MQAFYEHKNKAINKIKNQLLPWAKQSKAGKSNMCQI